MNYRYSFLIVVILFSISCTSQSNKSEKEASNNSNSVYWVNDYADVLSTEEESQLTQVLKSLEDSIGSQMVILTIPSIGDQTIEEYSLQTARKWKIGRANYDDGILITMAVNDRKVRIEVGYGLELIIRDEIAAMIIRDQMIPAFRDGLYFKGLSEGSREIIKRIYSNPELVGVKND